MNKQLNNLPHKNKLDPNPTLRIDPHVPAGNVVDLRKTNLGQKEYSLLEGESKIKKQEPEKIVQEQVKKDSFFKKWLEARKIKKEKKIKLKLEKKKLKQETIVLKSKSEIKPLKPVLKNIETPHQFSVEKKLAQKKENFSFKYYWHLSYKPLLVFAILSLVIMIPFATSAFLQKASVVKNSVMTISQNAIENIKVGSQLASEFNFTEASAQFNDAFVKFNDAQTQLNSFNSTALTILQLLPGKGKEFKSAKNLLDAATNLSSAATDITASFQILNNINSNVLANVNDDEAPALTDVIVLGHSKLEPASNKIALATASLAKVDSNDFPAEYQEPIALIKTEIPKINESLKQVLTLSETMLTILGHTDHKRYLVVFQNNRELRASGGFLGSFGLIDINKGKVTKMTIPGGGTYDLNGSLKAQVSSPEPLHLVNPIWQIQDANWWPDWPASAQKIEWFYNQSGGPTVDGVLSLTPDVIEQMLKITGPIDMNDLYGVSIDADNFYSVIQMEAEKKYDETRESKKIIADLTPKLLEKLFSLEKEGALSVLQVFYNALLEKDVLLYFNDPELEAEMVNLGWSGSIKDTDGDYLMVVDTNINGGKTDAVIEETINHEAAIQSDGSIIDTVVITRTHKGEPNDPLTNTVNWDYLRLYVPQDSQLIEASGFEQPNKDMVFETPEGFAVDKDLKNISGDILIEENSKMRINNEFNKTVFGNWIKVSPGESVSVKITYKIPNVIQTAGFFNDIDTYSLLIQKQPGSFDNLFTSNLIIPENYNIKWSYPEQNKTNFEAILNTDKYFGVVVEKK